ncbi:MAG: extensin family protein [Pseudomonadota bacterium]
MRMIRLCCACVILFASTALADAPSKSQRPLPRGVSIQPVGTTQPAPRPAAKTERKGLLAILGLKKSQRPSERPAGLQKKAAARIAKGAQGSVCGDASIKGNVIKPIRGPGACGVANPVRLTSVDGVALSQKPTIDCTTAKALKSWVRNGLKPAVGKVGGGVKSLRVVAHYACRNRNNARSGRLSEHAKGRAVDIAAINLNNGQQITVLKGWRNRQQGPILKRAHKAACGPFGTVLGPNANRFHQDHFHFDTARYRSGSYCR